MDNRKILTRDRFYRELIGKTGLKKFRIAVEETDLLVLAKKQLKKEVKKEVENLRGIIKRHIALYPGFYTSFSPVPCESEEEIINLMCYSASMTDTGPMASVAGAIAETIGKKILPLSGQVFIENGGDIYARIDRDFTLGIYAGNSPLSLSLGIKIKGRDAPFGIATSSGTIGHSFSYGKADAITVISGSAALSDGSATYFGNLITDAQINPGLIEKNLEKFPFIEGMLIIKGPEIFAWGKIELVSL